MMLENGSASSRMQTAVEDVPPPTPPALPPVARAPLDLAFHRKRRRYHAPIRASLPHPHASPEKTSPVASRSPFATPDGHWELGADI